MKEKTRVLATKVYSSSKRALRLGTDFFSAKSMAEKNFVFMHIPKAGGTTTRAVFHSIFRERCIFPETKLQHFPTYDDVKQKNPAVYLGHVGYQFAADANATKATLLRHPVERILSIYSYCMTPSIKQPLIGGLRLGMTLEEFLTSDNEGIRMNICNAQAWQLGSCYSYESRQQHKNISDDQLLSTAIDHVKEIDYVGVIEKFRLFESNLLDSYGAKNTNRRLTRHKNVAKERVAYRDLNVVEKGLLDSCISVDLALYDFTNSHI